MADTSFSPPSGYGNTVSADRLEAALTWCELRQVERATERAERGETPTGPPEW